MRGSKCVPLWLDAETYRRLAERARAQERAPEQQLRWILRQKLDEDHARRDADARDTTPGAADAG